MELLQLKYFFDSAQTENFAKTAQKYMVPTSSVSASVKRLESELNCALFDRTANRIVLNNNGKKMLKSLNIVFCELAKVKSELSSSINDNREIKMLVRAMRQNITDYIIKYNEENPHVAFKTVFDFMENEFEKYDIIIDEKNDLYKNYMNFELFNIRLRMVSSSKNPLCSKKLTLSQLQNQPFISIGEHSNMHKILLNACKKAGFVPNIVVMSNDTKCYDKLIESGIGIGICRESAYISPKVQYLDITDFNEYYSVYSYFKKDAAFGNIESFLDFMKKESM